MKRTGFTLIELLVVITIIVVLLALLTPALDRAIYQAELAVCATHLHGIGTGAQIYAANHRRRYPTRPDLASTNWKPSTLYLGNPFVVDGANSRPDFRPVIRDYIAINGLLNDPLSEAVDFETRELQSEVEASYHMFFGFRYSGEAGSNAGMMKLGDRWAYQGRRFNMLAGDRDVLSEPDDWSHGSHPDHEGQWVMVALQDVQDDLISYGTILQLTFSRWQSTVTWQRGSFDRNTLYQDGAVARLNDVRSGPREPERLIVVPEFNTDEFPNADIYVPSK